VYADSGLLPRLAEFGRRAFNPDHAVHHYASMFRHAMENRGDDGSISVKKLCYALRANAAVKWILQHETMPPTEFLKVVDGIALDDATRTEIAALLDLKSVAAEQDRIKPSPLFADLLFDHFDELRTANWRTRVGRQDELRKEMEGLLQQSVKGFAYGRRTFRT